MEGVIFSLNYRSDLVQDFHIFLVNLLRLIYEPGVKKVSLGFEGRGESEKRTSLSDEFFGIDFKFYAEMRVIVDGRLDGPKSFEMLLLPVLKFQT